MIGLVVSSCGASELFTHRGVSRSRKLRRRHTPRSVTLALLKWWTLQVQRIFRVHKIEKEGRLNVDQVSMLLDVQAAQTHVSAEDAKAGNVPIC